MKKVIAYSTLGSVTLCFVFVISFFLQDNQPQNFPSLAPVQTLADSSFSTDKPEGSQENDDDWDDDTWPPSMHA